MTHAENDKNRNESSGRKPVETHHDLGLVPMLIGGLIAIVIGGIVLMAFV